MAPPSTVDEPNGTTLLTNIGELITNDPSQAAGHAPAADRLLGIRRDAAIVLAGSTVAWIGDATAPPAADLAIDCRGATVLPGFVDSHSHVIFDGDRADEFAARMAGQPYAAGGIRTTVAATRAAGEDRLRANAGKLVGEFTRSGITTFEIKSGYGLTTSTECTSLQVAGEFTSETTYLGAHVVPEEYADDRSGYLALITGDMLAACAPHARWIDVFCDRGAFDEAESMQVLLAGRSAGLTPRVHANQLQHGPGVRLAVELGAASADHCTHLSESDITALADSATAPEPTVATLLPGAEFATRSAYPDARRLFAAGALVALATDCNPGTSFTTSMPFCIAVAVRDMHFTVAQAVAAATVGGARALRRDDVGRLTVGGPADLIALDAPSYLHLAYRPGVDLIGGVWRAGRRVR